MSDIFLSYESGDRPRAKIIAEALERHGYSVWWDRIISPGKKLDQVIKDTLDAAKCVIVLWSKESVKSDSVKNEAREGAQRHILLSVLIDDVKIPYVFKHVQAARLIDWQGALPNLEFELLLKSVEETLGKPPATRIEDKKPSLNELNLLAQQLYEEGKYSEAIDAWKEILANDAGYKDARTKLIEAEQQLGIVRERERKAQEEAEKQKAKQEEEHTEREREELKAGEMKGLPYKKILIVVGLLSMLLLGFWIISHKSTTSPTPIITSFELKLEGSGISPDTVDLVADIIKNRMEILGVKNATIHKHYETSSITVDVPSIFASEAIDIFREGKFEIRIQVTGNQTEHVLYGDQTTRVGMPEQEKGGAWGVPFEISDSGAAALRDAVIKYGAVTNPNVHYLSMYLDNNLIFDAPLAPDLAKSIQSVPVKNLVATTGTGDLGQKRANELMIYLRTGALPLPVDIKIVSSAES